MRILTWNVNHRSVQRRIPLKMADAIGSLEPNVVVLTEFVPGITRKPFLDGLSRLGLIHQHLSPLTPKENHILIASRTLMKAGVIKAPAIAPSVPSNALNVEFPEDGYEILGLRLPDYSRMPTIRTACWDWIERTAGLLVDRPSLIIGDLNTDPKYAPARCGDRIQRLINQGWQHAVPSGDPSYWSPRGHGVQIDHAFVSRHLTVSGTQFVKEKNGYVFVGRSEGGMSDHAVLVVDVSTTFNSNQED